MNRTNKRISEYPFQPLRRDSRRFPQRSDCDSAQASQYIGRERILIDSKDPAVVFL